MHGFGDASGNKFGAAFGDKFGVKFGANFAEGAVPVTPGVRPYARYHNAGMRVEGNLRSSVNVLRDGPCFTAAKRTVYSNTCIVANGRRNKL